ncbi:hypothetical protein BH20VER3_BH20VER3_12880 [soil metagenome]
MKTNPLTNTHRSRSAFVALLTLTIVTAAPFAAHGGSQCSELVGGLLRPLALTQTQKGNFIVAESGTTTPNTARLSIVDLAGNRRTLVEGLPAGVNFETNSPSGPAGLLMRGRTLYVAIGVGNNVIAGPSMGTTRANPNPSSPLLSSILAFHFTGAVEQNTQGFTLTMAHQQTLAAGTPVTLTNSAGESLRVEVLVNFPNTTPDPRPDFPENVRNVNPFGLVAVGERLFVSDGGQNLVWRVDLAARTFDVLARFPNIPNPQFPGLGGPFLEAVPTGITYSQGRLLVALFRGFPFPAGTGTIMQVDPVSGSFSSFIGNLKTSIDILAIRRDDDATAAIQHLVLQHASGPVLTPPGLLLRFVTPGGMPITEASCFTAPSGMVLDSTTGRLYVTQLNGTIVTLNVNAEEAESDAGVAPVVRNLSTRGRVGIGENVLIGGIIIGQGTGGGAARVAVRVVGPSLAPRGVAVPLPDPLLTLHDANGTEIARNDNWKVGDNGQPSQQAELEAAGLALVNDAESGLIAALPAGEYTAIARGKEGQSGVALVEFFHLP